MLGPKLGVKVDPLRDAEKEPNAEAKVDTDLLLIFARSWMPQKEMADYFGVNPSALHVPAYKKIIQQGRTEIRQTLRKKAIDEALKGNRVMLKFCLQNICGWSETTHVVEEPQLAIDTSDEKELNKKLEELLQKHTPPETK